VLPYQYDQKQKERIFRQRQQKQTQNVQLEIRSLQKSRNIQTDISQQNGTDIPEIPQSATHHME
jgi:hypothetical protein